jgi:hypothetical protein
VLHYPLLARVGNINAGKSRSLGVKQHVFQCLDTSGDAIKVEKLIAQLQLVMLCLCHVQGRTAGCLYA